MEKMLSKMLGVEPALINQLKDLADVFSKILPKFETHQIRADDKHCIAVCFPHDEANLKRIYGIEAVFEDILPPFEVQADLRITDIDTDQPVDKLYHAILFEIPEA
jgi:hypothetical protein